MSPTSALCRPTYDPENPTVPHYFVQDANWNVVTLLSEKGTVVERYRYAPYGSVTFLNPDGELCDFCVPRGKWHSTSYGRIKLRVFLRLGAGMRTTAQVFGFGSNFRLLLGRLTIWDPSCTNIRRIRMSQTSQGRWKEEARNA